MQRIDAATISVVLDAYPPERSRLLDLLASLTGDDWSRPTECPAYSVKGVAAHVLGDDLSLLSRQRDGALPGVIHVAERMPGADFGSLLDAFNDQWVEAARFFSPELLVELLRVSGEWTEAYYRAVDPLAQGEPVGMFAPVVDGGSPFWQAIAREFLERWVHHSQILRALGRPSLASEAVVEVGVRIVGAIYGADPTGPADPSGSWRLGSLVLGPTQQAADILTLAHPQAEVRELLEGPIDSIDRFAPAVSRDR